MSLPEVRPRQVAVYARLADGSPKATWEAAPLLSAGGRHVVAARWAHGRVQVGPLTFAPGDTVVEWYAEDAWFNIIAVWDGERGEQRGWYVNLARPAEVEGPPQARRITYTDLALDLVVTSDGAWERDVAEWRRVRGGLVPADRDRADGARARLRERLCDATPAVAWRDLEETLSAVAAHPGERRLPETAGRYGPPLVASAEITWRPDPRGDVDNWRRLLAAGERVAEAVYALALPDRQTLLHGKTFYPGEALRLPGGGVREGERPDRAARREAREETGVDAAAEAFLAYLRGTLRGPGGAVVVPSYVFLLRPRRADDALVPDAEEEQITVLRRVPWCRLAGVARHLGAAAEGPAGAGGHWPAWGRWRALQHLLAYQALERRRGSC